MPRFDFLCRECQRTFEALVLSQGESVQCKYCGSASTEKLLSPPPVIFKGSGFYRTDSTKSSPAKPKEGTKEEGKKETKQGETSQDKSPKTNESKSSPTSEKGLAP